MKRILADCRQDCRQTEILQLGAGDTGAAQLRLKRAIPLNTT